MSIRKKIKKRLPIFGRRIRAEEQNANTNTTTASQQGFNSQPQVSSVVEVPKPTSIRGDEGVESFLTTFVNKHQIVIFMRHKHLCCTLL